MKKLIGLFTMAVTMVGVTSAYSCINIYEPVCGTDGKTYSNECVLNAENREKGSNIGVAYQGECTMQRRPACTTEYDPVCGVDGKTYNNACEAKASYGVQIDYEGECQDIPSDCIRRYDGCNECGVDNGNLTYCTERACIQHDTPRCLEYEQTTNPLPALPEGCTLWHDGCNECEINQYGELINCTNRYCAHFGTKKCLQYEGASYYQYLTDEGMQYINNVFDVFLSRLSPYNQYHVLVALANELKLLIEEKNEFLEVSRISQTRYDKTQYLKEVYQYLLKLVEQSL